jgi:hypothetical protein
VLWWPPQLHGTSRVPWGSAGREHTGGPRVPRPAAGVPEASSAASGDQATRSTVVECPRHHPIWQAGQRVRRWWAAQRGRRRGSCRSYLLVAAAGVAQLPQPHHLVVGNRGHRVSCARFERYVEHSCAVAIALCCVMCAGPCIGLASSRDSWRRLLASSNGRHECSGHVSRGGPLSPAMRAHRHLIAWTLKCRRPQRDQARA